MDNDFIQFMNQAAQAPRLTLAFLAGVMQRAWTPLLATGITAVCGFVVIRRWRQRRKQRQDMDWQEFVMEPSDERERIVMRKAEDEAEPYQYDDYPTLATIRETLDEDAFVLWWTERAEAMKEGFLAMEEEQARWLYATYIHNKDIILTQRGSKVVK